MTNIKEENHENTAEEISLGIDQWRDTNTKELKLAKNYGSSSETLCSSNIRVKSFKKF